MPYIYTLITSWLIAVFAFSVAIIIFKRWRGDKTSISFGWFWLMAAWVWVFAGLTVGVWTFDFYSLAKITSYLVFVFVVFEGPFLIYYLVSKSLNKNKLARVFFLIYLLGSFVYIFFLFKEGLNGPEVSEWGMRFFPKENAQLTLQILYIGPTLFILFDFLRRIILWIRKRYLEKGYLLTGTISLLLYIGAGYFDARGLVIGWQLMLIRLIILTAVLLSYLAYSSRHQDYIKRDYMV